MHPAIAYALRVHRAINNSSPRQRWARLDIAQFEDEKIPPIVQMTIGAISFAGVKQQKQITRLYYVNTITGEIKWADHVHS